MRTNDVKRINSMKKLYKKQVNKCLNEWMNESSHPV